MSLDSIQAWLDVVVGFSWGYELVWIGFRGYYQCVKSNHYLCENSG